MKDGAKFVIQCVLVFGVVYLVWNVFWGSLFAAFLTLQRSVGFWAAAGVLVLIGAVLWNVLSRRQHGAGELGASIKITACCSVRARRLNLSLPMIHKAVVPHRQLRKNNQSHSSSHSLMLHLPNFLAEAESNTS